MKMIKYWLMSLAMAMLIAACKVSQPDTKAGLDLPSSYRQQNVALTADTVKLSWRTFFTDPLLVPLIEKALEKNNDIAVSMLNLEQLDLSYKQAKLGLLPTADLNLSANRTWLSTNSLNGSISEQFLGTSYLDDYSATLRVSWEADIWGKAKMQRKSALANYFAQQNNVTALKTRVIVQVAQAYYNLIALDEQLKVAQRNVQLGDSTLSMTRLQYASAQVSSLAVEQAEAQKKTAELLIPLALQNIAAQENALSILCGNYPDSVQRAGSLQRTFPNIAFNAGVPAQLLSRRPDVKAAEYAVVVAGYQAGLAKVAMYPSISLTPSLGSNSFLFNTWFDLPGSLVKTLGASLTQPIFQKRALKTAYEIAEIERQKTAVQFKQSVMTAVGEVSDALASVQQTGRRLELVEQRTATLSRATGNAMLLYKSAMASYLEVITAQNNALQNDLEAISIKKDNLDNMINLYRALGGDSI